MRCPVSLDTPVALSSPLTSIAGVLAVVEATREAFGGRTAFNLPALTVTVGEMLQALREVAGEQVASRVTVEPDEQIARIVGGWPSKFDCERTHRLGLKGDASYQDIIRQYLDMTRT
jgi:nucleoside-diphosphate-sugar epimerase